MKKAVFLDRDGVLNIAKIKDGRPYPPDSIDTMQLVFGAREGLQALNKSGFMLFCITNQPDVARGIRTRKEVEKINQKLRKQMPLDDFMVCYHDNYQQCMCRKPKPGMLFKLAKKHNINLTKSYMIGDRWSDIMAGIGAGCITIFINYNYQERKPYDIADYIVTTLTEAVEIILKDTTKKRKAIMHITDLNVKIFADGADKKQVFELNRNPIIRGFTTNPTLMRQAGVNDYTFFAKEILSRIRTKPISFEVFSDDVSEIRKQAKLIASWADNVNVKIPITNTKGQHMLHLIKDLVNDGVKINVTAMMTVTQLENALEAMQGCAPSYVSLFAGRIADTGVDPVPVMAKAVDMISSGQNVELIWASPRELLNIVQASNVGCHIITVTHSVLKKLNLLGKDLDEFSLETVKMFYNDAINAGYSL